MPLRGLLLSPPIAKAIFTFDAGEVLVCGFKFFANISHVRVDRVVGHEALHGRVH